MVTMDERENKRKREVRGWLGTEVGHCFTETFRLKEGGKLSVSMSLLLPTYTENLRDFSGLHIHSHIKSLSRDVCS